MKVPGWRRVLTVSLLVAANVGIFFYAPVYCSYSGVREFESDLVAIRERLRDLASPEHTVILGFESHFLGYRHAGYYLPNYLTIRYPEAPLPSGTRVFALTGRQTQLLKAIPMERYQTFIIFPLPEGRQYEQHLEKVKSRFPEGTLRTETSGRYEFLMGSTADLHYLFPSFGSSKKQAHTDVDTPN